jgi:raffinose/stachyose/melibiose transport system permease protein/N-acetylglucosamine transport system permease protein
MDQVTLPPSPLSSDPMHEPAVLAEAPRPRRSGRAVFHPARLFMYVALVSYCLTSVAAFLWTISISLKSNQDFFATSPWSPPKHPTLDNYRSAWTTAKIGDFFLNSALVTFSTVAVSLAVSATAAYVLGRVRFRGSSVVSMFFLSGLMIPGFLIIIPLYFLLRDMHLLGSLVGLGIVYVATQIPFNIYVLTGFFKTLPKELEEAAYVDGASPFKTFLRVMLPLAGPGLASVALLNCLTIWNEFFFALVFLSDESKFTLPLGLYRLSINAEYSAQWTQMFAGLVLAMIPVLIVFGVAQERITRGLTLGALKG